MGSSDRHAPFAAAMKALLFIIGCLTIHLFVARYRLSPTPLAYRARSESHCRRIHHVQEQCSFFRQYCGDEDDGIFSYLDLYYCRLAGAKPFAVVVIFSWLAILFTTLGIVASEYFSVNLSTIARTLHLSDTLAGVTLLALGNGGADIFSTFAAMKSNSSGMAIGELVGAAAFITSVVAGSMALVKPFHVVKASLIRDTLFLMVTLVFLIIVMVDGFLRLWHCIVMLVFYAFYVVSVMGWHWWLSREAKSQDGAEEVDVQDVQNEGSTSSEETPLLPQTQISKALERCGEFSSRRRPGFWEHWAEGPQHKVVYQAIGPSIGSTLHFRHKESLRRQHEAGEISTSNAQDGPSQMPPEQQHENSMEAHRSNHTGSNDRRFLGHVYQILFPSLQALGTNNAIHRFTNITIALIVLFVRLTLPVADGDEENEEDIDGKRKKRRQSPQGWDRWLLITQGFIAPQFMSAIVWHQLSANPSRLLLPASVCLGGSALFALIVVATSNATVKPRWFPFISIAGFIMSIAWISTVAGEMVSIFKTLSVILNVSEAILGLSVFAVGNSLDDLAANITVAQHRHPVMALSACFGGPLLNILLGISVSALYIFAKSARTEHQIVAIDLQSSRTLFIVAATVIITLIATLAMMLWTRWTMTKPVGLVLIAIWLLGTIANLILKVET